MSRSRIVAAALALAPLLACGSKHETPAVVIQASCDVPGTETVAHVCQDVANVAPADLGTAQAGCTAAAATWAASPCTAEGRVGTCTYVLSPADSGYTAPMTILQRYYGPTTATQAETDCQFIGGTFTAG